MLSHSKHIAPSASTRALLGLCSGYFFFYILTGIFVKLFTGKVEQGFYGLHSIQYLVYSTAAGSFLCVLVALLLGWTKLPIHSSQKHFLVYSGICTAIVIPTTTLMYLLPISVMVAMVIMRGSIIVVSRIVDAVQIRQGFLKKKVSLEENIAVVFAIAAVATKLVTSNPNDFAFVESPMAMTILTSYILAYGIRIYLMNYFKNANPSLIKSDNRAFFVWEQLFCTGALLLTTLGLLLYDTSSIFSQAILNPHPKAFSALLSGLPYGMVAFFSVFLFMFKGRTATFNGLVNRLTSLVAGTVSTLILYWGFGQKFPELEDWISLGLILIAILFLTLAEKKHNQHV